MKKQYTIVLAKHSINHYEEDWPADDNISCTYFLRSKSALYRHMDELINSCVAPWWWIFDGNIAEENLILSGAIDPDDIDIIKENLS